jgi:WXXGXW repeat (2 copies)
MGLRKKMPMKRIVLTVALIAGLATVQANAQHARVRLDFPVGIVVHPGAPAPDRESIWIGPEWVWRGGQYVAVPGHWERPRRHGAAWIPGHWDRRRHGWFWVPGHWRY